MSASLENGSFFGRARRPIELGGVTLAETTYAGGFVVPRHTHDHPMFCLALNGSFTEHAGRSRALLGPRAVFFQPAGEAHAETFGERPARLFNIQLGALWLDGIRRYDTRLPDGHHNVERGRLALLAAQLHTEYRLGAGAERLAVDGLLLSMLAELTRATSRSERRRPGWLPGVVALLHDRFRDNIGLADLAAFADVHPSHLAHAFRAHMGCTTGEYARRLRVEHARSLLATTEFPVSRIAQACGFADQSHLTRVFRTATGVTPAEYRRRAG